MAEPINLNKARKILAKDAARAQAGANRIAFGRTKAQKDAARDEARKARENLDGKKRDPSGA